MAIADATSRRFGVCELAVTDTLANLEVRSRSYLSVRTARTRLTLFWRGRDTETAPQALAVQVGGRECLIPDDNDHVELKKARAVLERCGVVLTPQKKGLSAAHAGQSRSLSSDLIGLPCCVPYPA